ncbi:bifunctional metallophosphatase/5'-nucleotidase [Mycoplasmopsis felifaucium]|uniref:5'-nucleotidase C-terminal domain-containing protein n=1 Tax=Mycoplasmopsis felifaucium TaxID=35768 RepID=A0ABZ2RS20_9BACT
MKKKYFLGLGLALSGITATVAPLISTKCVKTNKSNTDANNETAQETKLSLADVRTKYKDSYDAFNKQIKIYADELKTLKGKLDKEKDNDKKQELKDQIKALYDTAAPVLAELNTKYNENFETLRKMEKEENSKIRTVRIFHTNDEHGRIEFDDYKYNLYSGIIGTDSFLKNKKRDLLLSAGDLIQGLPLSDSDKGKTISKMAKEIGYDSVAIGNHEFDYGLAHILGIDTEINSTDKKMPFISANIYYKNYPDASTAPAGYDQTKVGKRVFTPYIIKEISNGLKVAIFGLTTPDTIWTSHPKNSELVEFRDPTASAKEVLKEIKDTHPDIKFVIGTVHLGTGRTQSEWSSEYLAQNVNGDEQTELDLIIDGHSHTYVEANNKVNKDIWVTQTEAYTKWLGDIELEFDTETGKIVSLNQVLRNVYQIDVDTHNRVVDKNDVNLKLLDALKAEFDKVKNQPAFANPTVLKHADSVELDGTPYWIGRILPTGLGIMASNALAWDFQSKNVAGEPASTLDNTIGLMNGGGLRTDLKAGDLNYGDILALSPFGNRITTIKVKGSTLIKTLEFGLSKGKSGAFAQLSSNVSYALDVVKEMDPKLKAETYVWKPKVDSFKINDKAIVADNDYYIVTNDFIAAGGDGYSMLDLTKQKDIKQVYEAGKLIDSIIEYGKHVTKTGIQLNENNFEKALSAYDEDSIKSNKTVNIPNEAYTNKYTDPTNS